MRTLIYIVLAILAVVSVVFKAHQLESKDKKEIISITEEWSKNGIPVSTSKVTRGKIPVIEKISGTFREPDIIECTVPEDSAAKLRRGQEFTANINEKDLNGFVLSKSRRPDVLTGLYRVRLRITNGGSLPEHTIVLAKVIVSSINNAIRFNREALLQDGENRYLWVIHESAGKMRASKRIIKTGIAGPLYIQALSGLEEGETICINGMRNLKENILVLPVDTEAVSQ